MLIYLELIPVETIQPIFCSKPHETATVLNGTIDSVLGKAIFNVIMFEIHELLSIGINTQAPSSQKEDKGDKDGIELVDMHIAPNHKDMQIYNFFE